jgi:surface carbohydrate biosynthesis protein
MYFKFKKPKPVDIIIFDSTCDYLFLDNIIDEKFSYNIVESKIDTLFITPSMIFKIIQNIIKIKNKEINILSYLYKIYLLSTINLYQPKIVLTYSDNNSLYHWLIRNDDSIRYMAIQNGIRQKFEFDILKKLIPVEINHDYYFCFGNYDIDFNKKMGFISNKSIPCGSLKLGISELRDVDIVKKYDICLLSNYKKINDKNKCMITREITENNMLLDKHIKDYCDSNNKSLIIALRSERHEEIEYYKSIYGNNINLSSGLVESYSSYDVSSESEVTVAYQSTLLLEMLAIKNKILHIDFTNNKSMFDYESPIKYCFTSFKDMELKINQIYSIKINDYIEITKDQQEYVMNYNPDNPPHEIINNHINSVLNMKSYVS